MPAIAIHTRSCHQATSHGLLSRSVPSPCIHWVPSPARVRTSPVASDEAGDPVADGVGDHDVVPDPGGDVLGQQAQPVGLAEAAEAADHRAVADRAAPPRRGRRRRRAPRRRRRGQRHGLGREAQVARLHDRRDVRRVARLQGPALAVLGHQVVQQRGDGVGVALPGVLRDDVALGVDQHQRRPGPRGVGLPGGQLGVVEHRVVDAVPLHGGDQGVRVGLVDELGRVDADDDQLLGVLLLHRAQLVEDVQAVDAAERPEVEQDEATSEVADGQRGGGVEPAAAGELGGTNMHPPLSPATVTARATRVRPMSTPPADSGGDVALTGYVDLWWQAVNDFTALLEKVPAEQWSTPDRPAGLGRARGGRARRAPRVAAGRRPSTSTSRSATPRTPAG